MSKIIHQFWHSTDVPECYLHCKEQWLKVYSDWQYKRWHFEEVKDLLYEKSGIDTALLRYDIQKWDLLKLLICYQHGGIFADMDVTPIVPLNVENYQNCFTYEPVDGSSNLYLHHNFFYACKHSNFIKFALKQVNKYLTGTRFSENYAKSKGFFVRDTTGPAALTAIYNLYCNKHEVLTFYPKQYINHGNHKLWLK